ncbi:MAG: hypothetical protein IPM82_06380 [Saprospiraceae bacterium]|nr:hypothetical protein [Saprospiraceae bacterium]
MHKNKVIIVLKSLTPDEIRQLDKFVRSPVHNQHDDVVRFFQYVRKHLSGGERALDKERVFGHLFPGEAFDMQQIHYISSYLLKVVEEFLAWKEWKNDLTFFGLELMKSYRSHRLEQSHRACLARTMNQHQSQQLRDSQHYLHLYQLREQAYLTARTQGRSKDFDLQQLIDAQDIAFIIEKLKNGCNVLSHEAVKKTKYKMGLLDPVIHFLNGHPFLELPSVAVYYHAYLALSDNSNENSFVQLKKILESHPTAFPLADLRDLYLFAINYCIKQLNSGNQGYLREVFEIYLAGMSIDIFIENGVLSPWTYSNFIISGIRLREFDQVESFINSYKQSLPEKEREGLFRYNYAFLYYEKKDYQKAMLMLSTTDYGKDLLTTCAAKTLLARMYFEQNEMETLLNLLQSFRVFIGRKELLGYHKDSYGNFINTLYKLINLRAAKDPDAREVRGDLANYKVVAAKEWLLSQLTGIESQ